MKIYTACINCKNEISLRTFASERIQLKMKYGDALNLTCKNCNRTNDYPINDLKAKDNKITLLIAMIVLIFGTALLLIFLWDYIWQSGLRGAGELAMIIAVPSAIYGIIIGNDRKRVSIFNRS